MSVRATWTLITSSITIKAAPNTSNSFPVSVGRYEFLPTFPPFCILLLKKGNIFPLYVCVGGRTDTYRLYWWPRRALHRKSDSVLCGPRNGSDLPCLHYYPQQRSQDPPSHQRQVPNIRKALLILINYPLFILKGVNIMGGGFRWVWNPEIG